MPTFRTIPNLRDGAQSFFDLRTASTNAETKLFTIDATQTPAPVVEVDQGFALSTTAFPVLTGTTRATVGGQEVVINITATERCSFAIEESADAVTWPSTYPKMSDDYDVTAGAVIAARFVPSKAYWRLRVDTAIGAYVKRVYARSQVRAAGV